MSAPFVLFINPWIFDFAAYDLWVKPLGLLYIAAVLKNNGIGVHFLDCLDVNHTDMTEHTKLKKPTRKETGQGHFFQEEVPKPEALQQIKKRYKRYGITPAIFDKELSNFPRPQAVFVTSMMTYWYPGVFEVIRRIKSQWPDVPVVLGGIYATLCNKHAQKLSRADSIVSGPGELEAVRILERLTGKEISGVPDVNDLDSLPYPEYELLTSKNALPIITSRGCPFRCTYCASSFLVPRYYQRNHLKVADELEFFVNKHGTTDYIFYDDALLFNTASHAVLLFNEILRRKLPVRLHSPNGLHPKYITHQVADLMMEAGFKTIRLGLETADPDIQQTTGGKVSTDEFIITAGALKKAGFSAQEVGVYILAGLPGQKVQDVFNTIQLVKDQGLKPIIAEYSPIPCTALWKDAISSSPFPIADEPLFHNNTLLPCQWEKFTHEDLQNLKYYSRKI